MYIVHYMDDESISKPHAHGNSKKQTKLFFPTKRSVLKDIEERVAHTESHKLYKESVSKSTNNAYVDAPRNPKQVANLRAKVKAEERISSDAILNCHVLVYELPDYVMHITTYPDLTVICGCKSMLSELQDLLQGTSARQLLAFDTTFHLGDFYVSPLLFRHTMFEEEPTMPAAFLVHERKLQSVHELFFQTIGHHVKALTRASGKIPIVTDEEKAIVNAIEKHTTLI